MKNRTLIFFVGVVIALATTVAIILFTVPKLSHPSSFNRTAWLAFDELNPGASRYNMALWLVENYSFCGKTEAEIVDTFLCDEEEREEYHWSISQLMGNREISFPLEMQSAGFMSIDPPYATAWLVIRFDKRGLVREAALMHSGKVPGESEEQLICGRDPKLVSDSTDLNFLIREPRTLGLGTLDFSFNRPIPLYRTASATQPFDTLYFEERPDGTMSFKTRRITALSPYNYSEGDSDEQAEQNIGSGLIRFYPYLTFRVLEANDEYFRIVTDEDNFETAVVRRDPNYVMGENRGLFVVPNNLPNDKPFYGFYIFETWEHLLKRAMWVEADQLQSLYDKPNGKILYTHDGKTWADFKVKEVEGEWMRVKVSADIRKKLKGHKADDVWMRWNDGKELTVEVIEYTYE